MPGTKTKLPPLEETIAKATQMVNEPITSSDLTSPGGFTIPNVPPATQASGMMGEIASQADAFTQSQTEKRKQAEQQYKDSSNDIQSFLAQIQGKASLTNKAYDTAGVDKAETELKNINDQIRAEQRALDNRIRSIEEAGGGLQGGAAAEVNNVRRESLRKQADLYVIQQGVQGKYDSAKAIADRAVNAYLEQQKIESDARMFMYQENKDLFTRAEQREFEIAQADRERAYKKEEAELKTISDISLDALQNGAPTQIAAQMRQAKTLAEAMEIGGQYVGPYERMKADSVLANSALDRRLGLLKLAEAGDRDAMIELGLDPDAPDVEQTIKSQNEITRLDEEIARVTSMLSNETGLESSSGVIRSPLLSSFGVTVPLATGAGAGIGSVVPGIGTVAGGVAGLGTGLVAGGFEYAQQKDQKADFLAKANYVITNLTTEKLIDLKARGVSFTPLSNEELRQVGRSAGEISGYAITDESGKVVGFTSEKGVRDALNQVNSILTKAKDREYQKMLTSAENAEIEAQ